MIEFRDAKKSFGENHVLKGVNLSIYKGEITAVIGKSGTGKSVLLKHIIGLIEPDGGDILYLGTPLRELSRRKLILFKRELSYMFQDNALFDFLNVFENIALPMKETRKLTSEVIREKVHQRMEQLGLEGIDQRYPTELSGGMRKRVALARALVTDPQVVLFDEPTTGLDPVRKNAVHDMIVQYQEQFGFTAVVVSHDIPEIFNIAQRIAMLDQGRISFEGNREDLLNSNDENLNAFVQGRGV
ncbi:MAG: ATP-binding cassette domain-containing protein [Desulfobacterales bacterium]|nr:ATP-binding cassette domain-containing protein [Desulfobacterales bacterium]